MDKNFFSDVDSLSRDALKRLQIKKLNEQIEYLSNNSPYYQRVFKENKIFVEDLKSLNDLRRIPFTDKYQVGESQEKFPPFGEFLCVPEEEVVKYFRTSGTTFNPRNFAYTYYDWWHISIEMLARMKYSCGVRAADRAFIAFPYNTFIALWSSHYACERIGCMVIPGGGTSTKERLNLMRNMKVTVLCATPTYAYRLANVAGDEGIDLRDIPLKRLFVGGEPLAAVPGSRARLEQIWHAKVYDYYGCNESTAPIGRECKEQNGLHVAEDILIPEILNEDGEQVDPGERGELVISNIAAKTMPLLRFRTGDIVTYDDEPCPCGQNSIRIKILGRTDDMIVIKGTNVFPSMIEEMVKRCPELGSEFMIVIEVIDGSYELIIQVEPEGMGKFKRDEEEAVKKKLAEMVRENIRIRPAVQVKEPGSLPRFEVKSRRVIDKRNEDAQ
ncbi:MAG: AMP-binding protein [Methanomassiliicoccales archaeon]|nr:MAG: AMP-binding protein [Methanomassiliicoccales archaeon]